MCIQKQKQTDKEIREATDLFSRVINKQKYTDRQNAQSSDQKKDRENRFVQVGEKEKSVRVVIDFFIF